MADTLRHDNMRSMLRQLSGDQLLELLRQDAMGDGISRDGAYVAEYAVDAVATMVSYGILTGNNNSELNPTAYMSRAEMAVVLARVLDL